MPIADGSYPMLITDHLKDQRRDSTEPTRHPVRPTEPRVLIADDQADVLEALRLLLKAEGFQLETASSPAGVLAAIEAREFDVALIDLNYARDTTSGEEGLNLLSRIQSIDPTLPVVVMTAWGSVEVAVEAMRRGARDFIQKPWDNARLLAIIRTQIELSQALRKGQRLEAENSLLRGQGGPRRPLRAGGPRHAVPGRNRQRAAQPAGQAAARHRDRRVRAARLVAHPSRGRSDHLRNEREPSGRSGRGPIPSGSAVPVEHDRDPAAAASRPARGHPAHRATLPPPARAALSQAPHGIRERRDADAARAHVARQRPRAGSRR